MQSWLGQSHNAFSFTCSLFFSYAGVYIIGRQTSNLVTGISEYFHKNNCLSCFLEINEPVAQLILLGYNRAMKIDG